MSLQTERANLLDQPATGSPARAAVRIFGLTIFLSAFLLFQVQLIISKYILPWFGGSAAVWTTCMLVFQILLLGGYVYSHLLTQKLAARAQVRVHLAVITLAFLVIATLSLIWPSPITPAASWKPMGTDHPVRDVIVIVVLAIGLPFFVLSTTGPLLQRWLARQGGDSRTYRLYSISNFGSLLALLTFPLVMEPLLRLRQLGVVWSVLFALFCIACGWCALSVRPTDGQVQIDSGSDEGNKPTASRLIRVLWFLLAACASSLFLATTNQLCQEIISLPLLWVLPLALYLFSFILCFDNPRWYRRGVFHPLLTAGVLVLCAAMVYAQRTTEIAAMPVVLFAACMICHGELARFKPEVKRLTAFYLTISAGGACGGLFVAIVAPRMFRFFTEFQLSLGSCVLLAFACLILDENSWIYSRTFWLPCVMAAGVIAIAAGIAQWIPAFGAVLQETQFYAWAFAAATLLLSGAYILRKSTIASGRAFSFVQPLTGLLVLLLALALYNSAKPEPGLFLGERNFYGALRVFDLAQGGKALFHAHTLHGAQLNPPNDRLPMAYYGPESGIGIALRNHPKRQSGGNLRVGIVGLGAGTLAAYGIPGDYFRYYEINPQIVELSQGPRPVFTYVRDSAAKIDIELGDARLLLEQELARGDPQSFDLLVLDAFSGDAVPVHLLTKEAFDSYSRHLRDENSLIAVHLSSRHINLLPVVEGLRDHSNSYSRVRFADGSYPFLESLWVFLAKQPQTLEIPGLTPNQPPAMPKAEPRLWTDDYSDIFRLIY